MLKSSFPIFIQPISKLFNNILHYGIFPNDWNCSLITSILKSGSASHPSNYKGIAVAYSLSKLFLKIITKRIDEHMASNHLWSKNQNGFKKNIRKEDNLFILKTAIHESNVINKKPLFTCFVDLSKFFDMIDRNMLLYKLMKYGITGNIYKLIKSMYDDCVYAVKSKQYYF